MITRFELLLTGWLCWHLAAATFPLRAEDAPLEAAVDESAPIPAEVTPESPFPEQPPPKPVIKADPKVVPLPAELFEGVRDMTRGIRDEERDAYYETLAHARSVDYPRQQAAARKLLAFAETAFTQDKENARRKFSLFYDIIQRPDHYRGQPITLHGYIQKLDAMDAGENDQGLKSLHQVYLYTADSFRSPYVVVCSEIPPGVPVPRKGNATNDIVVTGFFFKLWAYEAQRGNWGAPLILAQRLEWKPPPDSKMSAEMQAAIGISLVVVAAGLVFFFRKRAADDRKFREAHPELFAESERERLQTLRDLERE